MENLQDPTPELTGAPIAGDSAEPMVNTGFGAGGNSQSLPDGVPSGVMPSRGIESQVPPDRYSDESPEAAPESEEKPTLGEELTGTKTEPAPAPYDYTQATSVKDLMEDQWDNPLVAPAAHWLDRELSSKEVDIQRAFGNVLKTGDTSLVDVHYLREKLGDAADSVLETANQLFAFAQAEAERGVQEIYSNFGGEESAKQACAYFKEHADAGTVAAISQMLDSRDKTLVNYAVGQIKQFAKPATVQHNSPAMGSPSVQRGLSAMDFRAQSAKAKNEAEYNQLVELRKLGMAQGI